MAGNSDNSQILDPLLFVCESNSDVAFVRAALRFKNRQSGYSIRSSSYMQSGRWTKGGITEMGRAINSFRSFSGFVPNVRHIVLVIDNDISPDENFKNVKEQVGAVAKTGVPHFAVPTAPHRRASTGRQEDIDITVLTIPAQGTPGTLEQLLLPSARAANWRVAKHLDDYCVGTKIDDWSTESKKNKMKLRCLLSASHEENPEIGIGKVWADAPSLIPIDHSSLQSVVDSINDQQP